MRLIDTAEIVTARPGTRSAALTFPALLRLSTGEILLTWRAGQSKDCPEEELLLARSTDRGASWSPPERVFTPPPEVDGASGTFKLCYLTETAPGRLIAAAMWVDRSTHPGKGLFNEATEGCLPMAILLAQSEDGGRSFGPWQRVKVPEEIGPPSLTSPLVPLPGGRLLMSLETNKHYDDTGPWHQRAVGLVSTDGGQTWGAPRALALDPEGRIFNWDLRIARWPGEANGASSGDAALASFAWTFDRQEEAWRDIHRRVSRDGGTTWSAPQPLGFRDQAGIPAVFPDGRAVLPYVDRFDAAAINARACDGIAGAFGPPVTLHDHAVTTGPSKDTGALLTEMSLWSFGLPFALALPAEAGGADEALTVFYAGTDDAMSIHAARLAL